MRKRISRNIQLSEHLVVALKYLDRIPSLLFLGHIVYDRFFNVCDRVFNRSRKSMHRHGSAASRSINSRLCRFHYAGALECGDFNDLTSKAARKLGSINLIAVFADYIHHVYSDHDRNTKFGKLCRKIKISFKVCTVNNVKDRVGSFSDQIISRHHFFKRIRRKRIDTGKVGNGNAVMLLKLTFLLFNSNTRPVSHELV